MPTPTTKKSLPADPVAREKTIAANIAISTARANARNAARATAKQSYQTARQAEITQGIKVAHYPVDPEGDGFGGGVTVASRDLPGTTRVELALATCNPKDRFDPRRGYTQAVEALLAGKSIAVPNFYGLPHKIIGYLFAKSLVSPFD